MVKKILYVCFVFVMMVSITLAEDDFFKFSSSIDIRANEGQNLVIRIRDAETGMSLKSISVTIGSTGREKANFKTNSEKVNISIVTIKNISLFLQEDNIISKKEVGPFVTNEVISLNIKDNLFNDIKPVVEEEPKINISETNETEEQANLTEETEEIILPEETFEQETESNTNQSITGFSVFGENVKSNYIYYILGFLLITGFVIFFTIRKNCRHKQGTEQEPTTIKLSELKESDNKRLENAEKKLAEAEQELRQAQSEINEIKNKGNKIQEAEQEFKRAKERLDGLREGFEQKEPRQDSLSGYNRNNSTI